MELNSGGNVKLTSCDPSQPCFNSCSELVHSRFSVADVENLGISGLEVTEVIRVENRLLFNGYVVDFQTLKCEMYCWRICMLFQLAFKIAWSQCYTRLFTNSIPPSPVCDMRDGWYFFSHIPVLMTSWNPYWTMSLTCPWQPHNWTKRWWITCFLCGKQVYIMVFSCELPWLYSISGEVSMSDICHYGFAPDIGLSSSSLLPIVWLTNSVNIADHMRLTAQESGQGKVERGRLLLCKVFTGRAVETTSRALWVPLAPSFTLQNY